MEEGRPNERAMSGDGTTAAGGAPALSQGSTTEHTMVTPTKDHDAVVPDLRAAVLPAVGRSSNQHTAPTAHGSSAPPPPPQAFLPPPQAFLPPPVRPSATAGRLSPRRPSFRHRRRCRRRRLCCRHWLGIPLPPLQRHRSCQPSVHGARTVEGGRSAPAMGIAVAPSTGSTRSKPRSARTTKGPMRSGCPIR